MIKKEICDLEGDLRYDIPEIVRTYFAKSNIMQNLRSYIDQQLDKRIKEMIGSKTNGERSKKKSKRSQKLFKVGKY